MVDTMAARARVFGLAGSLLLGGSAGCNAQKPSDPAPASSAPASTQATPASSATKRLVDAVALRSQCLVSTLRTPPRSESNTWLDVGAVEADGTPFGWLIAEQSDHDVPLEEARFYLNGLGPLNVPGNASHALCASEWDEARSHTILTSIVRVGGTETKGTYAVLGGKADALPERGNHVRILEDVSLADARKEAFAMAAADVGSRLVPTQGPSGWFDAAR